MEKRLYLESNSRENDKYLTIIIENPMITCDEIIEEIKTVPANFNGKKVTCRMKKFCILLTFLLIITALLTAFSIYY